MTPFALRTSVSGVHSKWPARLMPHFGRMWLDAIYQVHDSA